MTKRLRIVPSLQGARPSDDPAAYRGKVVQLPWPNHFGQMVLISIDWNGVICDWSAAADEPEADRITERMYEDLDRLREEQRGPQLVDSSLSPS